MKDTDFCPVCRYYLYLSQDTDTLRHICRNCGYQKDNTEGGLILEINLKEKTHEGYKVLMNEFTKYDPTLPHTHTIKCPTASCPSNISSVDNPADIIYLKYDPINLKYLYICNKCDTQWRS